jgi:two-component system, response regulator YesN
MKFDVLIVEDNKMIREGIIKGIDWDSMGFNVVGEGSDGLDGIRKYNMLKPDVKITEEIA